MMLGGAEKQLEFSKVVFVKYLKCNSNSLYSWLCVCGNNSMPLLEVRDTAVQLLLILPISEDGRVGE